MTIATRKNKGQSYLFDCAEAWRESWKGMPSFHQDELKAAYSLKVNFRNYDDMKEFAGLIGQNAITEKTRYIYHPEQLTDWVYDKHWISVNEIAPKYPIYIISKGRWESPLTANSLDRINVDYKIVVEPQEYDDYAKAIDPKKILVLPFSNLGQGSIPARNWVWDHSIEAGAERHWILDDNLRGFQRLVNNTKINLGCGAFFRAAEDFTDRYENVPLSGLNYVMFTPRRYYFPPYVANTRIYSCILIKNDFKHRWRGRYNEDTDLSLRALKDGDCTILFNAFTAMKTATMMMKGGNTDELYVGDGRLAMARSLQEQHPDVVAISRKWGRWQHHVDYSSFKRNKFILKADAHIEDKQNEYGMTLKTVTDIKKGGRKPRATVSA